MLERIADLMLVGRPGIRLPISMTAVASRIAAAIAGEDPGLIEPLMGRLGSDILPARHERARRCSACGCTGFDRAVERGAARVGAPRAG